MHITKVMGGIHLHVHTCARADVPLLCISETSGQIALKFGVWLEPHYLGVLQRSKVGFISTCACAHVQMCTLFRISERTEGIALKFGVLLENR